VVDILIKLLVVCEDMMLCMFLVPPTPRKPQNQSSYSLNILFDTFPTFLLKEVCEWSSEWHDQAAIIWDIARLATEQVGCEIKKTSKKRKMTQILCEISNK